MRSCCRANVFVERLRRSVKYEEVCVPPYGSEGAARAGGTRYFEFYNNRRAHRAHDGRTPDMVYFATPGPRQQAARAWNRGCL
jgi:putative transposase